MSEKRQLVRYIELFVVITGFFVIAEAFRSIIPTWNPIRTGYLGLLMLVMLPHIKNIILVIIRSPHLLALLAWAVLSALWSENRNATLSRLVALSMTTFFAMFFATRYRAKEQLRILAVVMTLYVVTSLFMVGIGQGTSGLAFEGVFTQKNVFGRVMTIGVIVALVYPVTSARTLLYKRIGFVVCALMVGLSLSATSLIALVAVLALFLAYRVLRLGTVQVVAMFIGLGVPIIIMTQVLVTVDPETILTALGRDATLTGRTDVWDKVSYAISYRPWLGYGYGSFWNMWGGTYGTLWSPDDNWTPGSAHNAYLDITVNLGYIGLGIFLTGFIITYIQALYRVRRITTPDGLWPALYVGFLVAFSFSEDYIMINNIFWTMYMVIVFTLNKPVWLESPEEYKPRQYTSSLSIPAPVRVPSGG